MRGALGTQRPMEVRSAVPSDLATYVALGQAAQAWLRSRDIGQYVPSAHDEYAGAIQSLIESGTLFAVCDGPDAVGFFSLDSSPSPWWPPDEMPALYLAGMVVARSARGRGVGPVILRWSLREAARRSRLAVRLDCYADNPWLCEYYESHGFVLRGRVEQHADYDGCLYELAVHPGQGGAGA